MPTNVPARLSLLVLLTVVCADGLSANAAGTEDGPKTVRVMSFNLWNGGDSGKQPLDQTVAVIRQSQADIVGLQETAGLAMQGEPRPNRAAEIARELGWHYFDQGNRTGVISRYKIVASTPGKWGVKLELPSRQQLYCFNAHLAHSPYQPYQLLGIPYGDAPFLKTADEAVQAARDARGEQVDRMLAEVKAIQPEGLPVFLTGDFNEPSHHDWTTATVMAKHSPAEVPWPSTRAVVAAGFIDAYRAIHPDPVTKRGLTWTPTTDVGDPRDRHDRIDFVFVGGGKAMVRSVAVVGETKELADIVVTPYPSDHRAVVAEVELPAREEGERLIVCGGEEVFIIPASGPPPAAKDRLWRWTAADCPEIPADKRRQFLTTDECKPVGDAILITSSSNGVALVRRHDKKCLFYASARNAHSACLLPERRVAVASSFGGDELLVFDQDLSGANVEPLARMPLKGAHGTVWDAKRERLWALGNQELLLVNLNGPGAGTKLTVDKRFDLPSSGGHDLSACRDARYLFITTESHVYRFDTEENLFEPHSGLAERTHVKSVDEHPTTGDIVFHQATEMQWWSDSIRFTDHARNIQIPDERIYKARWDVPR